MIAEMLVRRKMAEFFAAFAAKDVDRIVALWPEDVVIEFPAGTPMAGEWRGRAEVAAIFRAVFAHNSSMVGTLHHVSVLNAWSPTGNIRVYAEWSAVERGIDGDVLESDVVSVSELRRWRPTRSRDYFSNVPGFMAHYATMPLPDRRTSSEVAAVDDARRPRAVGVSS